MRKSHFIVTYLIVLVFLAPMTASALAAPSTARANWTVMVYMSGDNDLESYVVPDLETELAFTGSGFTGSCQVPHLNT